MTTHCVDTGTTAAGKVVAVEFRHPNGFEPAQRQATVDAPTRAMDDTAR